MSIIKSALLIQSVVDRYGYHLQAQGRMSVGTSAGTSFLRQRASQLQDCSLPLQEMVLTRRLGNYVFPVGAEIHLFHRQTGTSSGNVPAAERQSYRPVSDKG